MLDFETMRLHAVTQLFFFFFSKFVFQQISFISSLKSTEYVRTCMEKILFDNYTRTTSRQF